MAADYNLGNAKTRGDGGGSGGSGGSGDSGDSRLCKLRERAKPPHSMRAACARKSADVALHCARSPAAAAEIKNRHAHQKRPQQKPARAHLLHQRANALLHRALLVLLETLKRFELDKQLVALLCALDETRIMRVLDRLKLGSSLRAARTHAATHQIAAKLHLELLLDFCCLLGQFAHPFVAILQ